jgi:hypothetical protein
MSLIWTPGALNLFPDGFLDLFPDDLVHLRRCTAGFSRASILLKAKIGLIQER